LVRLIAKDFRADALLSSGVQRFRGIVDLEEKIESLPRIAKLKVKSRLLPIFPDLQCQPTIADCSLHFDSLLVASGKRVDNGVRR